jgi:hypothetical protein
VRPIDLLYSPVRSDELGGQKIVAGQAAGADQVTDATAQREAAHSRVGERAARRGEPVRDRRLIDVEPERSTLHARPAPLGVDADGAHETQIDRERAVGHGMPRDAMTATAHSDREVGIHGELDGGGHPCSRARLHDHRWPVVDERVEHASGVVVFRGARPKHQTVDPRLQVFGQGACRHRLSLRGPPARSSSPNDCGPGWLSASDTDRSLQYGREQGVGPFQIAGLAPSDLNDGWLKGSSPEDPLTRSTGRSRPPSGPR